MTAIGTSIVDAEIGKAGDVDTAVVTLRFADGRIAVIKNSRRAVYGYDQRIDCSAPKVCCRPAMCSKTRLPRRRPPVSSAPSPSTSSSNAICALFGGMGGVRRRRDESRAVPVTLDDGVNALAVAEAATRSAKGGATIDMGAVIS